ncbi:MAG: hypothetical protein ACI4D3_01805 [Lachnospiraceae bacterium]
MDEYKLKTGKMAEKATSAYKKIEETVVDGYKKVEDTVVGGYKKIEDAFVDAFLEKVTEGNHVPGNTAEKENAKEKENTIEEEKNNADTMKQEVK